MRNIFKRNRSPRTLRATTQFANIWHVTPRQQLDSALRKKRAATTQKDQDNGQPKQVLSLPATLSHADLKDESGGSLFMTVRMRVNKPFFPSHTRLLSVLTRASTSGMLAFMDMALSSFSSWLFSRRYLFLQARAEYSSQQIASHAAVFIRICHSDICRLTT